MLKKTDVEKKSFTFSEHSILILTKLSSSKKEVPNIRAEKKPELQLFFKNIKIGEDLQIEIMQNHGQK